MDIIVEKREQKKNIFKSDINEIINGRHRSERLKGAIKKIQKQFWNHNKKLSNCLMIILNLHLSLNIDQFMVKGVFKTYLHDSKF